MKKCTVSTQSNESLYQDRQNVSDDQYPDFEYAESVETYDENELDQGEYNHGINDARKLNNIKKEMNCQQVRSPIQENLEKNLYS